MMIVMTIMMMLVVEMTTRVAVTMNFKILALHRCFVYKEVHTGFLLSQVWRTITIVLEMKRRIEIVHAYFKRSSKCTSQELLKRTCCSRRRPSVTCTQLWRAFAQWHSKDVSIEQDKKKVSSLSSCIPVKEEGESCSYPEWFTAHRRYHSLSGKRSAHVIFTLKHLILE